MKRMKTFLKYLILFIALYVVSNFLIDYMLYKNYSNMDLANSNIQVEGYDIKINSAKSTNANGEIEGSITKNSENSEDSNLLKIDFYNERNNLMGTEYLDTSDLANRSKQGLYNTI